MDSARIAELLAPFLGADGLSAHQLDQVSAYLDRLMRWNARMNLTSVRDPEQIVTRHFGESFFAAKQLLGREEPAPKSATDIGSGAGFPGLPIKILAPSLRMRLVEAQHRKAIFLREVIRDLQLADCEVLPSGPRLWPRRNPAPRSWLPSVPLSIFRMSCQRPPSSPLIKVGSVC